MGEGEGSVSSGGRRAGARAPRGRDGRTAGVGPGAGFFFKPWGEEESRGTRKLGGGRKIQSIISKNQPSAGPEEIRRYLSDTPIHPPSPRGGLRTLKRSRRQGGMTRLPKEGVWVRVWGGRNPKLERNLVPPPPKTTTGGVCVYNPPPKKTETNGNRFVDQAPKKERGWSTQGFSATYIPLLPVPLIDGIIG